MWSFHNGFLQFLAYWFPAGILGNQYLCELLHRWICLNYLRSRQYLALRATWNAHSSLVCIECHDCILHIYYNGPVENIEVRRPWIGTLLCKYRHPSRVDILELCMPNWLYWRDSMLIPGWEDLPIQQKGNRSQLRGSRFKVLQYWSGFRKWNAGANSNTRYSLHELCSLDDLFCFP